MLSDKKILFVIGAQKAGTTWLRANLFPLKSYSLGPIKELHFYSQYSNFFNFDWCASHRLEQYNNSGISSGLDYSTINNLNLKNNLSESSYIDLISFRKGKIFCDFSPEYSILETHVLNRMILDFPNSKFVYILRDPLDRAISQIRMQSITIYDSNHLFSIENHTHIISQSRYTDNLKRVKSIVSEDNLMILDYDDISKKPLYLLKKIHLFVSGETISDDIVFNELNNIIFSFSHFNNPDHLKVYNLLKPILQDECNSWKSLISS